MNPFLRIKMHQSQVESWKAELESLKTADVQPQITQLTHEISDTWSKITDIEQEQKKHHDDIRRRNKYIQGTVN